MYYVCMYMDYLSSEGTKARLVRSQTALQETKCGDSNNQLQTAQQSGTVQSHLLNVLEDYCCAVDKQIGLEYIYIVCIPELTTSLQNMHFSFIGLCQLVYKMTGQWKLHSSLVNHFFPTCSLHIDSELMSTNKTVKILTSRMLRPQRSLSTACNHIVSINNSCVVAHQFAIGVSSTHATMITGIIEQKHCRHCVSDCCVSAQ